MAKNLYNHIILFAVFHSFQFIQFNSSSFSFYFTPLSLDLLPVLAQSSLFLHNIASRPIKQQVQIPLQNRWAQLFLWPLPTSWLPATQSLSQHVSWQTTAALHSTCLPRGQTDPACWTRHSVSLCVQVHMCVWCGQILPKYLREFGTASFSGHPVILNCLLLMKSNFYWVLKRFTGIFEKLFGALIFCLSF